MESLWMDTFKDSLEYVSLVFDNYFKPEISAWKIVDDEIISAILGVEYGFSLGQNDERLKGLYLCGISTVKEYRHRGVMSSLLEDINSKAKTLGYDFTFLIPANNEIKHYYRNRGYHDSFYKLEQHFVKGYNYDSELEIDIEEFNLENIDEVVSFLCRKREDKCKKECVATLIHTPRDWEIILRETKISNERVDIFRHRGNIVGVTFYDNDDTLRKEEIRIKKLLCNDAETEAAILKKIELDRVCRKIILVKDITEEINIDSSQAVWEPFFAENNGKESIYQDISLSNKVYNKEANSVSFGMIRILDINTFLNKIFANKNIDFSGYSDEEIEEIVLRKPVEAEDELEKLLDLPRMDFSMSLLLE